MDRREKAQTEMFELLGDLLEGWLAVVVEVPMEWVEQAAEHFYRLFV